MFKESRTRIHQKKKALTDSGYQGIQKLHANSELPKKRKKKSTLTKEDKRYNRQIARDRVINENVIDALKRFKIIADIAEPI